MQQAEKRAIFGYIAGQIFVHNIASHLALTISLGSLIASHEKNTEQLRVKIAKKCWPTIIVNRAYRLAIMLACMEQVFIYFLID